MFLHRNMVTIGFNTSPYYIPIHIYIYSNIIKLYNSFKMRTQWLSSHCSIFFEDGVYKNDQSWSKIMKDGFLAWKLANFMVETIFFRGVCAHSADETRKQPGDQHPGWIQVEFWAKTDSWLMFYVCCMYIGLYIVYIIFICIVLILYILHRFIYV